MDVAGRTDLSELFRREASRKLDKDATLFYFVAALQIDEKCALRRVVRRDAEFVEEVVEVEVGESHRVDALDGGGVHLGVVHGRKRLLEASR